MSNQGGKKGSRNDDDDRKDLTRIEDLSEFLHQEDPELDSQFGAFNRPEPTSTGVNLDSLDDNFNDSTPEFGEAETLPEEDQLPPDLPADTSDSMNFGEEFSTDSSEDSFAETIFDSTEDTLPDNLVEDLFATEETPQEEAPSWDMSETPPPAEDALEDDLNDDLKDELETAAEDSSEEFSSDEFIGLQAQEEENVSVPHQSPEKFADVKTFAQNFSYGKSTGGGNPPYSIIVRNLKYKDDAEDILALLREFDIVTKTNEAETIKALQMGVLLIPQISEYCAIVLAHKFRRFDLDLEVGLSDEVHPSKSGEVNPRGLVKKESLKQNKTETLKFKDLDIQIKDVLVTTAQSIDGYRVLKHHGVQTVVTLVEEEELEKLAFVSRQERDQSPVFEMNNDPEYGDLTSKSAYQKFMQNYAVLYDGLTNELKQKAFRQKANALLGISFQLSPLHFDRHGKSINAYQITCSATLASIVKEES